MSKKKEIVKPKTPKVKEISLDEFVDQVFGFRIMVAFEKPARGTWDGKMKAIEFIPEQVEVDNEPAIRWTSDKGEYSFIVMCRGKLMADSVAKHLETAKNYVAKEKKPKRTVTIRKV